MFNRKTWLAVVVGTTSLAGCTPAPKFQCPVPGSAATGASSTIEISSALQDWDGANVIYDRTRGNSSTGIWIGYSKAAAGGDKASGIYLSEVSCDGTVSPSSQAKVNTKLAQGRRPAMALAAGQLLLSWSSLQNLTNTAGGNGGINPILSRAYTRVYFTSSFTPSAGVESPIVPTQAGQPFNGDVQVYDLAARQDGTFVLAGARSTDGKCAGPFFERLDGTGKPVASSTSLYADLAPDDASGCVVGDSGAVGILSSPGPNGHVELGWKQANPIAPGQYGPASVLFAPWDPAKLPTANSPVARLDSSTQVALGDITDLSVSSLPANTTGVSAQTAVPQYIAVIKHDAAMSSPDAGMPQDAGMTADAGDMTADAGMTTDDGGMATDDGGTTADAGTDMTADAGAASDAGASVDAGTTNGGQVTSDTLIVQDMAKGAMPTMSLPLNHADGQAMRPVVAAESGGGILGWTTHLTDGTSKMTVQKFTYDGTNFTPGASVDFSSLVGTTAGRIEAMTALTDSWYFVTWSEFQSATATRKLRGKFVNIQ